MNTTWVYTLADILQMPLTPMPNGKLSGAITVKLADAPISYDLSVVTSHENGDELGLILRAERKLYMYLLYTHSTRMVDLYFINADDLGVLPSEDMIAIDCTSKTVLDKLRPGIVKGYYRNKEQIKWINH